MKTDDLIAALASDAVPPQTRPNRTSLYFALPILAGLLASLVLVLSWLGPQPLERALASQDWWVKFGYALLLGGLGWIMTRRAAWPGATGGKAMLHGALILFALMAFMGVQQIIQAPAHTRLTVLLGRSWTICAWLIVVVSSPIYVGALISLKLMAPTRPAMAGAAAGLFAGGAGAAIYAIHCPELAQSFVALWYSLGIGACTGIGALIGSRALRW